MDFIHPGGTLIWVRCGKTDRTGTNLWPAERFTLDWGSIVQVSCENPFRSRGGGGRRVEFGGRGGDFKEGVE